jgi:hypothetical protein
LKSTRKKHKTKSIEDKKGIEDSNPAQESATNTVSANLIELNNPTHKSYLDLTRRFPIHSSQGNLYVLVLYLYDDNTILVEPLNNRREGEQIKAYTNLLQRIPRQQQPKVHWTEN